MTFDSKLNAVHPLIIVSMYAKVEDDTHNGSASCAQDYFDIYPVTLTSKLNMVHSLNIVTMYAKFEDAYNGSASVVFTRLFPYMSIVTLTVDLKNQ